MKPLRISERYTKIQSNSFKQYLNDIAEIQMFTSEEETDCALRASNGDKQASEELVRRNLRFVVSIAKQYESPNVDLEDLINEGNIGLIYAADKYNTSTGFKFISYAVFWIRKMILEYLAKNARSIRIPSNKLNGLSKLNQKVAQLEQEMGRVVDVTEIISEYGPKLSKEEVTELSLISQFNFESLSDIMGDDNATLGELLVDDNIKATDHLIVEADLKKEIAHCLKRLKPIERTIMIKLYGLDGTSPLTLKEIGEDVGLTRERVRQIKEKTLKALKDIYVK